MSPSQWKQHYWKNIQQDVNSLSSGRVNQVDIVPSIAAMYGLPMPLNSLGVMIESLLSLWDRKFIHYTLRTLRKRLATIQVNILMDNAQQIFNILNPTLSSHDEAMERRNCLDFDSDSDIKRCLKTRFSSSFENAFKSMKNQSMLDTAREELYQVLLGFILFL
jgi:hypothetical protein